MQDKTIIPHAGTIPALRRALPDDYATHGKRNAAWGMSNVYQSTLFWYAHWYVRPGGRKPAGGTAGGFSFRACNPGGQS